MNEIEITLNPIDEDDATGHGLTENVYDVAASNDRFNEDLIATMKVFFPDATITVVNRSVEAMKVFVTGEYEDVDVELCARETVGAIYAEGDFWTEEKDA